MLGYLPPFIRKSKIFLQIMQVEGLQFDQLLSDMNGVMAQMSIDTATWGLAIYERELGLPVNPSKPLAERRSVVKSKLRGTGRVGAMLIKIVADAYTNGEVEVSFNGKIIVTFTSVKGIPPNIQDVYAAIEEIKPAHLDVNYVFLYNTHQVLSSYTHGQLADYTHGQLRTADIT